VYQLIKRTLERHIGVHLLIPFGVAVVFWLVSEAFLTRWNCHAWSLPQIWDTWPTLIRELISIYLVFIIVVALSMKNASDVRWAAVGHLQDILPTATRYFAIGTIPLHEWFEPNSLVYLATILRHQMVSSKSDIPAQQLRHERVLLFYSEADLRALQASFLDEHYAKSFAAIHQRFGVPLAYLGPDRIKELINGLDEAHKVSLGCYEPRRIWSKKTPALRAKPELLPFAWIERNGGAQQVIQFLKNRNTLVLPEVHGDDRIAACAEFVRRIEKMIYDSNRHVKEEFKFSNFLYP
jgi:hypothetical protein